MKKFMIMTFSLTILASIALTGCKSSSGTKEEVYPQLDPETKVSIQKEAETDPDTSDYISEEKAKEIALSHAKFNESEVQMLHASLDEDDGVSEYEVEFYVGNTEYNYEINAKNGQVISFESEIED